MQDLYSTYTPNPRKKIVQNMRLPPGNVSYVQQIRGLSALPVRPRSSSGARWSVRYVNCFRVVSIRGYPQGMEGTSKSQNNNDIAAVIVVAGIASWLFLQLFVVVVDGDGDEYCCCCRCCLQLFLVVAVIARKVVDRPRCFYFLFAIVNSVSFNVEITHKTFAKKKNNGNQTKQEAHALLNSQPTTCNHHFHVTIKIIVFAILNHVQLELQR